MNYKDWYVGAVFIAFIWVVAIILIAAIWLIAGVPMLFVSHVLNILSLFFLLLGLLFAGIGSGMVVYADQRGKVRA